jgi:hypothetical protein
MEGDIGVYAAGIIAGGFVLFLETLELVRGWLDALFIIVLQTDISCQDGNNNDNTLANSIITHISMEQASSNLQTIYQLSRIND